MKLAIAECFFPDLKGNCYRTGRGKGSNPKAAISRAIGHALKQIKGKRWSTVRATITVTPVEPVEPILEIKESA